jgi:hypothetical protein
MSIMGRLSSENSLMISSLKGSREVTSGRPRFFGNATVADELGMSSSLPSLSLEVADMVDDIVLKILMVQGAMRATLWCCLRSLRSAVIISTSLDFDITESLHYTSFFKSKLNGMETRVGNSTVVPDAWDSKDAILIEQNASGPAKGSPQFECGEPLIFPIFCYLVNNFVIDGTS